jgi:murein DD-endopeptidase MepM/ murein hydrolase activator NlpD
MKTKTKRVSKAKTAPKRTPKVDNPLFVWTRRKLSTRSAVLAVVLIVAVCGYAWYTVSQAASGYRNPLRSVRGLNFGRIDQGVDFGGSGSVYAIGDGVVTNTYAQGWPNHVFINYKLTSGSHSGQYVYVAENCTPAVHVGTIVSSTKVLCHMFGGIETGYAKHCHCDLAEANGSRPTAAGKRFSNFLRSLGVKQAPYFKGYGT